MTARRPPLVCTGRVWDPYSSKPASDLCGEVYERGRGERQDRYELRARLKGWALGPPTDTPRSVMCPKCRYARPDKASAEALALAVEQTRTVDG